MSWVMGYGVCLLTLQLIRYSRPFQGDLHTPRSGAYASLHPRRIVIQSTLDQA